MPPTVSSSVACGHVTFTIINPAGSVLGLRIVDVPGDNVPFSDATHVTVAPYHTTTVNYVLVALGSYLNVAPDSVRVFTDTVPAVVLASVSVVRDCSIIEIPPASSTASAPSSAPAQATVTAPVTSAPPGSSPALVSNSGGALASTGSDSARTALYGGMAVLAGIAFLLAARRRGRHS